jgi:WD40 repeat protein
MPAPPDRRRFLRATALGLPFLTDLPPVFAAPPPRVNPQEPAADPEPQPGGTVFDVEYSPDGKLLAVVDGDGGPANDPNRRKPVHRLTLFDTATYKVSRRLTVPADVPEPFHSVRFAPDGKTVNVLSYRAGIFTCDLQTGVIRRVFNDDSRGLFSGFALSPDGTTAATHQYEGRVGRPRIGQSRHALWKANTFELVLEFRTQVTLDGGFVYAPDGKALATSYDGPKRGVVELDPATGKELRRLELKASGPGIVPIGWVSAYSPDGKWLVIAGGEGIPVRGGLKMVGYLRVWDRVTGTVRNLGHGALDYFRVVALSRDGTRLFGATESTAKRTGVVRGGRASWQAGWVCCWDTATWKELWDVEVDGGDVEVMAVSPDGRWLWAADRHDGLRRLDAATGKRRGGLIYTLPD